MPCSPFQPEHRPMTEHSDGINLSKKPRNQLAKEIIDLRMKIGQSESSLREVQERLHVQRIQNNQVVLDMRRRLQWQEEVIGSLKVERDRLMRDLTSRLLLVEAELRREQKHIETLLEEKDRIIEQQGRELQILKDSRDATPSVPSDSLKKPWSKIRNAALSRRFSIALDEYIRDCTTVSRASPIFLNNDGEINPFSRTDSSTAQPEGNLLPRKFPSYHNIKREVNHEANIGLKHLENSGAKIDTTVEANPSNHLARYVRSSSSVGFFPLKKHEALSLPDLSKGRSGNEESDFCSVEVPERNNMLSRLPSHPNLLLQGSNSIIKIPWYKPPPPDQCCIGTHASFVTTVDASGLDSESLGSSDQSDSLDSGISVHSASLPDSNEPSFGNNCSRPSSKSFQTHGGYEKISSDCSSSTSFNNGLKNYVGAALLNSTNLKGSSTSSPRKCYSVEEHNSLSFRAPPEYSSLPPTGIYEHSRNSNGNAYSGATAINSDFKTRVVDRSGSCERLPTSNSGVSSWVSGSSNRSFGTNHRSVTKPRDIKFRKLTKFQNRLLGDTSNAIGIRGLVNEVVLTV